MPNFYSYVMPRDFGFAPNPFGKYCTLATCKPQIRGRAKVGDWVFGTTSLFGGAYPKLIYAMKVSEILTFDMYYADERFQAKKALMNGSLKTMYGDNIYHHSSDGSWLQDNSHHSLENGETNILNLNRDTATDKVLISEEFYYFGCNAIAIPTELEENFCKKGIGYRTVEEKVAKSMLDLVAVEVRKMAEVSGDESRYMGDPASFLGKFQRYNGK